MGRSVYIGVAAVTILALMGAAAHIFDSGPKVKPSIGFFVELALWIGIMFVVAAPPRRNASRKQTAPTMSRRERKERRLAGSKSRKQRREHQFDGVTSKNQSADKQRNSSSEDPSPS